MGRRIGVLALQGDFREHCEALAGLGHDPIEIRNVEQLWSSDALIIPGGESTTISRLIISNGLLDPLRQFCAEGWPVWGTCAGAILLAANVDNLDRPSIGAMEITVRRNAFGRQVASFEAELDVEELGPPPFRAVFIRAPLISSVRDSARVLAHLPDGGIVAARQVHLLATSFHPELTEDRRFHEYFLAIRAHTPARTAV